MIFGFVTSILFIYSNMSLATDWSKEATLPGQIKCEEFHGHHVCFSNGNRKNILELDSEKLNEYIVSGGTHALNYPVTVTQMRLPKQAMEKFFESDTNSPLRKFIFKIAKKLTSFDSFDDIFNWLGLHKFPNPRQEQSPNPIPYVGHLEAYHMGVSELNIHNSKSLSFSCAACHSSDLFGVKILGMTNRFPRANEAFILGEKILKNTPAFMFDLMVNPSSSDLLTFKEAKDAMKYVTTKKPLTIGLDTSLAQVGLSLAKRGLDDYASKIPYRRARKNPLNKVPADSKPAVWWNLKYKTKWLSDGSIISGNPVHTNFLWNEIGRGVNLDELEEWLLENKKTVDELTTYVFHTKAPRFNDFFPRRININKAKRGEKLFLQNCKGCHGEYTKGWSLGDHISYEEKIETIETWYHTQTKVIDVKTDQYRYEGMNYFYKDLNRLQISKSIGTVVTPQKGYVPPPLEGIWARWPYFHNNSVPTLYDVLTPSEKRPKSYIAVPAEDKLIDFDFERNGYPRPDKIRLPYREDNDYFYNTKVKGLSNKGHSKMMRNEDGTERFNHNQKLEIIEFLRTL